MKAQQHAEEMYQQLVTWRRDFHMHPELGCEEYRTAGIVAVELQNLGYRVRTGVAETGVVGVLENGQGPVIMTRVDMDALPIQEANAVEYTSQNPGLMHACGHDAHVAIGLGIATVMAKYRDMWQGTLKVIFQPGEEGMNGAEKMVQQGVLDDPHPDAVLAVHVWNPLPVGSVAATIGPVMAAAEAFHVTITGKGGHAAKPEETVDPVVIAAMTVSNLQTIVSRNVSARETAVVTVGSMKAGDAFNVIPPTAELKGTVRTFDSQVRETVLKRLTEIVYGTARMMGAQATLEWMPNTPAVVNDAQITGIVQKAVVDLFGESALIDDERTMGSEDAAYFLREIPGSYIFIGAGPVGEPGTPHHNPHFNIEEASLKNGVAVVVATLRRLMPYRGA
ncbi:MAG: amidohydrolase [Anaerolineae bacterium]|nr:amidohydrolase [Anaerolineae bacterium]